MLRLLILLLLIIPLSLKASAGNLNSFSNKLLPFTSDGCSSFPDSYNDVDWTHCCVEHDIAYWAGGTSEQRAQADKKLNLCVQESAWEALGQIMEIGVLFGGSNRLPTSWSWGYGWVMNRSYKALSEVELNQVNKLVPENIDDIKIEDTNMNPLRKSITGDYCLDEALAEIKDAEGVDQLNYKVMQKRTTISFKERIRSYKIRTNNCDDSYTVHFRLMKRDACVPSRNEALARVLIRFQSLESSCLNE